MDSNLSFSEVEKNNLLSHWQATSFPGFSSLPSDGWEREGEPGKKVAVDSMSLSKHVDVPGAEVHRLGRVVKVNFKRLLSSNEFCTERF